MCMKDPKECNMEPRQSWIELTLVERHEYLDENLHKADCEFLVGSKNDETPKILKTFKWILSDVSPMFSKMFKENNANKITIEDITAVDFEHFLSFIHRGVHSVDSLKPAYDVAKKYMLNVEYLMQEMKELLLENWKSFWLGFLILAYSRDDVDLKSVFESIASTKNNFSLSWKGKTSSLVTEAPVVAIVKLIKLQLLNNLPLQPLLILELYLRSNSKNLSNLEKDSLRRHARTIKIPPNEANATYTVYRLRFQKIINLLGNNK